MKKTKISVKLTVVLAMLAAVSIICGKYLAINGGEVMRFSLENMPIIFAGISFGPLAGAAVGAVADIVGCLMVGYTINPLVTLGAAAIGFIAGIAPAVLKKAKIDGKFLTIIAVASAHLVGSVLIKTVGLAVYYSMPLWALMLWRALNYLIVGAIDGTVIYLLMRSRGIKIQINKLRGDKQ